MTRLVFHEGRCCPSELRKGEAKRVPRSPLTQLVGIYVGCPGCGRPQVLTTRRVDPDQGKDFVEENGTYHMTPAHTCDRCGASYTIRAGVFVDA